VRRRTRRNDWCSGCSCIGSHGRGARSARRWPAQAVRHLERVEDKVGAQVRCQLPAGDHAAVAVEDEGEADEAVPGPEAGDLGDHFSFGRIAAKSRCSRSRARSSAASSAIVVLRFLPRRTPSRPSWRISRATQSR
jgi:hypothetical protein